MSIDRIEADLKRWRGQYGARTRSGATEEQLLAAEETIGRLPSALRELLSASNGLEGDVFKLLPLFDERDAKTTWDSIERANDPAVSRFLDRDQSLLARFIVFADIGGGRCALFGRDDHAIWYEDDDELCQTDFSLDAFIEASLKELG